MIDRLDQDLSFTQTALRLRSQRQEMLASNIANADTPHYKARDIDFKAALAGAMGGKGGQGAFDASLARTHAGHLAGADALSAGGAAKYRSEYQGAIDGNTVNMDIERAAFAENAMQVEALMTFINKRFQGLGRAISGQ